MGRVVALRRKPRISAKVLGRRPRLGATADAPAIFHRNQREAGIEHLEWEWRLRPMKSWLRLATECALVAGGLSTIVFLARLI